MEKNTFILAAMQTKDDFLSRFLDISQDDVETTEDNKTLMDMISDVYDQMPDEEVAKFQFELAFSHDYINLEEAFKNETSSSNYSENPIEERLLTFRKHVEVILCFRTYDRLELAGIDQDVESYGTDRLETAAMLSVYWRHYDRDELIEDIAHVGEEKDIFLRLMELAEEADYNSEVFKILLQKSELMGDNPLLRPPFKKEIETVLHHFAALGHTSDNKEVYDFANDVLKKWSLNSPPDQVLSQSRTAEQDILQNLRPLKWDD